MSDSVALKSDFLGSFVGSIVSHCMWDAKKHIKSSSSCWTRPLLSSTDHGKPLLRVASARHTAYYRSLMQRPMRLNLSWRCNKGRVVINRTSANYRPLAVRWRPSRGVVSVVDHRRGRRTAHAPRPRSPTGRGTSAANQGDAITL